jgi:hypothetical protein
LFARSGAENQRIVPETQAELSGRLAPPNASTGAKPRSYARARVAVAPVGSTSSWNEGASATRRWTKEETRARAVAGPRFRFPSPDRVTLDALVAGYEQITTIKVLRPRPRNLIAACYRVHGDDFLGLVREFFMLTGTADNLLGHIRELQPRAASPGDPEQGAAYPVLQAMAEGSESPESPGGAGGGNQADADSAWCGCSEDALRPGVLYCDSHRPVFGSMPRRQYDRKPCNPAAARFFAQDPVASKADLP